MTSNAIPASSDDHTTFEERHHDQQLPRHRPAHHIDEVTARLQAANGSVLYALADLMTVFASHAELNGGDFVEIAGEKFQKLADLAGLPNVCAARARTWWRAVAEHRGLEHDGDYVLDTSSSASCQHYIDAGYYLTRRPGVGHDLTH